MKLKSFVIALAAVMLLMYCCAPLQAAKAVKLPGHISGLLKDKFSTDLIVTHPGKYLFQFQQSGNSQKGDKTAAKTNFRDYVDISIISKDGTKIAGNFFPGEQGSGYHSDFFTLNVDRSDNLKLLITPIAEKAKNMNFMIFCDHVAPQVLVMGMEWYRIRPGDMILLDYGHNRYGHSMIYKGKDSAGNLIVIQMGDTAQETILPAAKYQYYKGTYRMKGMDKVRENLTA